MSTRVVVATAADENYAIPLAVTVRSLIDSLAPSTQLRLVILDGGISTTSRERLKASWDDPRLEIEWQRPDTRTIAGAPVSGHVSAAAYLRLLLPTILDSDRVIYLDSDMLVRRDVTALWDEPQGDSLIQAVQDLAAPWIDAEVAADRYAERLPLLAAARPVANYRELGLRPEAPYFNSGLMVANLALWREERIAQRVLECLQENSEQVLWWDQYALNVVLADRWRQLDHRWNQGAHIYNYPSWRLSPVGKDAIGPLRREPWIVHFCSPIKPWQDGCRHPFTSAFFETLERTEWRGWRPAPAPELRLQIVKEQRRLLKQKLRWSLRNAVQGLWRKAG
ncbi:glycosyltransferase family 8 protein [Botrimarina mediterranea]|uniref:glycosyltransferase family 8 protein n=1 Tax=Botrimarina mediterranea TaxID=2528022 RepID=UPI001187E4E8|nr:General stress protein A [Planctomycetes bacterium K2D]